MSRRPDISWCRPGGSREFVTTRELVWRLGKKGLPHPVTIPAGYEFESSVPRLQYRWGLMNKMLGWFQPIVWLFPPDDPFFLLSACVHDWLLEDDYDLDFCDSQWLAAARKSGAPKRKAQLVRLLMLLRRYGSGDTRRGVTWK